MNLSVFEAVKTEISTIALFHFFLYFIACSQTLYFLFKVRGAHVIKNKKQGGFIDRQRNGVGVGEEENRRSLFFVLARALLSPMFSKRTKSKKKKQRLGTDYSLFERASIKPGTWNIPEHSGTSRNMKKLK